MVEKAKMSKVDPIVIASTTNARKLIFYPTL
jgi:hypothetical protein